MNVKLLTPEDKVFLKSRYSIFVDDDHIVVRIIGYGRESWHELDKGFSILSPIRKVTFSDAEIQMWQRMTMFSLWDFHEAYTKLKVSYQPITESAILKMMRGEK